MSLNAESVDTPRILEPLRISPSTSTHESSNVTGEETLNPTDVESQKQTSHTVTLLNVVEEIGSAENLRSEKSSTTSVAQINVFNYNNPQAWPHITDAIRTNLILHCSEQGKDIDFKNIEAKDGRRFSPYWFNKKLPNCESVDRNWLIFSKDKNAVFCFCCCLFELRTTNIPHIANRQEGFSDWKNINRIEDHEKLPDHRKCFLEWKTFEARLKNSQCIDNELQKSILLEKERWRHILRAILDSIMFCAKNNLALRGSDTKIDSKGTGVFLDLIKLLGKYDKTLEDFIEGHKKGSVNYLSPEIQNEFIGLLGQTVRNEILSRIRKSKYYSLLFDCTPDVSHNEQMTEIIRYVQIDDGKVSIQESFIDFICTEEKTGEGLSSDINKKLEKDKLDIQMQGAKDMITDLICREYKGVQAHIQEKNDLAVYVPCASHCLNLAGVHSASSNAEMKKFFETVESIFKFFSRSTSRWNILKKALKISVKGHCDVRWSSKANAIKPLNSQITELHGVLQDIIANPINPDSKSSAESLLKNIDRKFLFFLDAWNQILGQIDRVTVALQAKSLFMEKAAHLISGLKNSLQELRDTGFEDNFIRASTLADTLGLESACERSRKKKRLELYEKEDDGPNLSEMQKLRINLNNAVDILIAETSWRYEKMMVVSDDFGFLSGESLQKMTTSELRKAATDLALKYKKDINVVEFVDEISDFKHVVLSIYSYDVKSATVLDLLQLIRDYNLRESYPNVDIAFRIFLTMPVTIATCERSFSKLKLVKNYLRSTMSQERLTNLAILSIEYEVASKINFDDVIDEFAAIKSRKIQL